MNDISDQQNRKCHHQSTKHPITIHLALQKPINCGSSRFASDAQHRQPNKNRTVVVVTCDRQADACTMGTRGNMHEQQLITLSARQIQKIEVYGQTDSAKDTVVMHQMDTREFLVNHSLRVATPPGWQDL